MGNHKESNINELKNIVLNSFEFGDFTMKDGKKSRMYINGKKILSDSRGLYLSSKIILNELYNNNIEGICGEVSGACPLIGSVLTLSQIEGKPLRGFYIRKREDQIRNKIINEINIPDNMRVSILDDVSSSGMTALRCKKIIDQNYGKAIMFMSIIDRDRSAKEKIIGNGMIFKSIFSINDFMNVDGGKI